MAKQVTNIDTDSEDFNDETSSIEYSIDQEENLKKFQDDRKDSINKYVLNILEKHGTDVEQINFRPTIEIQKHFKANKHQSISSAFRQYNSNGEDKFNSIETIDDPSSIRQHLTIDQLDESLSELNLDPDPLVEQRESDAKVYKQKVYLRQLQPPTPQPVEIQVREVLLEREKSKSPLEVRVGLREPRTPSPIIIKSAPPKAPVDQGDQPIIYNKYVPPPKRAPQQIIIHRHPDLPPKPRPIIIEQWLPYKPAPKRIIKECLSDEARRTPPPPHNLIVSYTKPRALVQVELVRLPIVRVDPETYKQMSSNQSGFIEQSTTKTTEQNFHHPQRSTSNNPSMNQFHWRI